ncbi:fumarylacetoacetate hydrolase family protein [Chitinasiproducens palmae]|uniref:5-carboxy-2-oxohept-3-enedioate decarboxylase HpaG1 subunit n=1 Tax=Chitinasiproducens palmae TaxID=1770053 RepID=A0A1H2PK76_9BURK|nr:fumarylacetoacetate hydrolase family protein [Chitinasiproducens palmae]SDV46366.1 5-carboxy-2-oxohept-3-enedioate decarboxylase HpaG1 subunit [Chitinasiproducens palmae]
MSFQLTGTSGVPIAVGTVYGALLNYREALAALGDAVEQPPYKQAPVAPILYIKTRNTFAPDGASVAVPADVPALEIGAALGVVIGRQATRVAPRDALAHVAGYVAVADISVPHQSVYRPAVRQKCRDGFCPIGAMRVATEVANPDSLAITVSIDGEVRQRANTSSLVRPVAALIADVTDFMTLMPGDILLVGVPHGAPQAHAGQAFTIDIASVGSVNGRLVAAAAEQTR